MLRYLLLGVLNYRPMNGYQIKQFMESSTAHFWHAKLSQIYMTLKTLEEEALIISHIEPQSDKPDRRVYTITDAGRAAMRAWLLTLMTELEPTKEPLLLKLFFSAQLDKQTVITQLEVQRALFVKLSALYQEDVATRIENVAKEQPQLRRDAVLWEATRRLGELSTELYIRWLDETIQSIHENFDD